MASTSDTPDPASAPTSDFAFTIDFPRAQTLIASGVITPAQGAEILQDATAAAADWGQYIAGQGTLRISLDIRTIDSDYLADTSESYYVPDGTLDGKALMEPASEYVLTTGQYQPGTTSDITITLGSGYLSTLYLNPDPSAPSTVPANEYDLVTILRHEMGHGLGIVGYLNTPNPTEETPYDHSVQQNSDGTAFFTGPTAELVYGGPVPLTTTANSSEQFYHFGNAPSDPDSQDLMRGLGLPPGQTIEISPLDLAVMKDIGEPVLPQGASPGVVCFAQGTRLAGPEGERGRSNILPSASVSWRQPAAPGGLSGSAAGASIARSIPIPTRSGRCASARAPLGQACQSATFCSRPSTRSSPKACSFR